MKNLDQVVKDGIRLIEKKVDEKLGVNRNKIVEKLWKGKRIISIKEWESKKIKSNYIRIQLLDCIPDGYIDIPILPFPPDRGLEERLSKWQIDYNSYLDMKKDPGFGEYKCRRCILHPWHSYYREYLREIILKGITYGKDPAGFPCTVLNMFECPYEKETGSNTLLLILRKMWELVNHSLNHVRDLDRNREKTYEVDFDRDRANEYHDKRLSGPNSWGTTERSIGDLKFSKVQACTVEEIFNVLRDKKALKIIIEQYLEDKYVNAEDMDAEKTEELEFLRSVKDYTVKHFSKLRDKIRIEDVRNDHKQTLEEEKLEEKEHQKRLEGIAERSETCDLSAKRNDICITCGEFSNIHCINCDIWVCLNHWREHKLAKH